MVQWRRRKTTTRNGLERKYNQNQVSHQLHTSFQQNHHNPHLRQIANTSQSYKYMHPTSVCEEDLAEEFYEQLESTIEEVSRKDLVIIQGEWNARRTTTRPDDYEQ